MGLELDIPWTNYYDDFPVVDFKILSEHTGAAARALTSMLGFECSLDKELPFDRSAEMLGVVLDLSEFTKGVVKVCNKFSRMSELKEVLTGIIESGRVPTKSLASFFGRALFVESQFMGKAGKLALAEFRSMEKANKSVVTLSEVQSEAMRNLLERYDKGVPRSLEMERTQLPCVVFTDGYFCSQTILSLWRTKQGLYLSLVCIYDLLASSSLFAPCTPSPRSTLGNRAKLCYVYYADPKQIPNLTNLQTKPTVKQIYF